MLTVLNRRFSNIEILLIPASVQGNKAPGEIVAAIEKVNELAEHDVILMGRGGGSLEDLWSFNEEVVARAIFKSTIPIISCVGHEIDFTIADFVADLRAPTPSAAAEIVVRNKSDLQNQILNTLNQLRQAYLNKLKTIKNRLIELSGRIVDPRRKLQDWQLRLSDLQDRLQYTLLQNVKDAKTAFESVKSDLPSGIKLILERKRQALSQLSAILKRLSPFGILERGYAIAQKRDVIIRKSTDVRKKDEISIQLFKGKLICEVKEIV